MTESDFRIVTVTTQDQRREFAKFPWSIYRDDPNWVPPIFMDHLALLSPGKHPFHEHAEVELFLAKRGDDVVGTISAQINHLHNETFKDKVGFFGFFEVIEEYVVAEALLEKAAEWLRERGMEAIRGPENFSQNEEVGLLIDGFDSPPRVLMTYNPRYYQDFIERAGFQKAQDLYAWDLQTSIFNDDVQGLPRKFLRVAEEARKRDNLVVRNVDMKHYDEEVERIKQVYNEAWEQNWGFVPLTDNEMEHLAQEMKMVLDPDIVFLAEVDGKPVGVSISLPEINQAMIKARPQPNTWSLPLTLVKFLWYRRKINAMRAWAVGVIPGYRRMGIEALFTVDTVQAAFRKGFKRYEMGWTLESNDLVNRIAERLGGEIYKTYRIYEKPT
ncbi:GNAT family N-acetyltransferase [Chloroflexota bacterium]